MDKRRTFYLFFVVLFLCLGCAKKNGELNKEQSTSQPAAKPPIIDTKLTREIARQLIQATPPAKLFDRSQGHGIYSVWLDNDDCAKRYLAELQKKGIASEIVFDKNNISYRYIHRVTFSSQWEPFVGSSFAGNTWRYVYLDPASVQVVGIKQAGERGAVAEVVFAANKWYEVSQKYECVYRGGRYNQIESRFQVKFELWDDGWRVASEAEPIK